MAARLRPAAHADERPLGFGAPACDRQPRLAGRSARWWPDAAPRARRGPATTSSSEHCVRRGRPAPMAAEVSRPPQAQRRALELSQQPQLRAHRHSHRARSQAWCPALELRETPDRRRRIPPTPFVRNGWLHGRSPHVHWIHPLHGPLARSACASLRRSHRCGCPGWAGTSMLACDATSAPSSRPAQCRRRQRLRRCKMSHGGTGLPDHLH
jgi:hypothetical protein